MARPLTALHLSDLHFSKKKDSYNQDAVLRSFLTDIEKTFRHLPPPDLVLFTGDIVHSADEDHSHAYAAEVMAEIARRTKCSEERFLFCPGNHDAHQRVAKANYEQFEGNRLEAVAKEDLNGIYFTGALNSLISDKFQNYQYLPDFFSRKHLIEGNPFYNIYEISEIQTQVISINTAIFTTAGAKDYPNDNLRLIYPDAALSQAIDRLKPQFKKILLSHHPIGFLHSVGQNQIKELIHRSFDFHLFGHMHIPAPQQSYNLFGSCFENQSAALYQKKDLPNRYCVIMYESDSPHIYVQFRTYFTSPRSQFDLGIDVAPRGEFYSSPEAQRHWYTRRRMFDATQVQGWIAGTYLPELQRRFNEGLSTRPVCEVFVPPPMYKYGELREEELEYTPTREEIGITFTDIIESNENLIIRSTIEHGKTTLLQQICISICEKSCKDFACIPVMIDFSSLRVGRSPMLRLLRSAIPCETDGFSIEDMARLGKLAILIDDLDFADSSKIKILSDFIKIYPGNRYIFTVARTLARAAAFEGNASPKIDSPVIFTDVFFKELDRKRLKSFVQKWDRDNSLDLEETVRKIIEDLRVANMPYTAVNGTILLSIYNDLHGSPYFNRSILIERFIEHLLERSKTSDAIRGAFDYKIKCHILSLVAKNMAMSDKYVLSYDESVAMIEEEIQNLGLPLAADRVVSYFIKSKVFSYRFDGTVSFKYRAFLEYFIALQMSLNSPFKDWVTSEKRYLSFGNEIQYYAAITRNDVTLLDEMAARMGALDKEIVGSAGDRKADQSNHYDPEKLDNFVPPTIEYQKDVVDHFHETMNVPPLTEEERDTLLDTDLPKDAMSRQEVYRPALNDFGERWTMGLLIYSGILINLELIGAGVKRQHFSNILKLWNKFTFHSLLLVPYLAREKRLWVNGVKYEISFPKHYTEAQIARTLYHEMPISVSRLMYQVLSSRNLDRQIRVEVGLSQNESSFSLLYRALMSADLRLKGWLRDMRRLVDGSSITPFTAGVLFRKVSDLYSLGELSDPAATELRAIALKAVSALGLDEKKFQVDKASRIARSLDRRRYTRSLHLRALEKKSDAG